MDQSFYAGDAIRIEAELRDSDDALIDPDTSTKITIVDPISTVKVNAQDMTRESEGIYYYIWQSLTTDTLGVYRVKVVAVNGSYTALTNPRLFELKSIGI